MKKQKILSAVLLVGVLFWGNIFKIQASDLITTLTQSHTIEVKQSWFSFNKSYKIYVEDQKVGKVEGLYLNLFGDRLVLSDLEGVSYGYEQQIKRWNVRLNRLAQVYDNQDKTVGFIGEEVIQDLFRWGKTFHFYDNHHQEIAISKEKIFKFFKEYNIEDLDGNTLYKIKKKFSLFETKYEISIYNTSVVPVEQVIFLTCILDAITLEEEDE